MKRWSVSIGLALFVTALSARLFGPAGLLAAGVVSFLAVVARHDNRAGTCLPLAVLLVLILGVCVLLLAMMALAHGS